jgi:hypothetical protein
VIVIIASQQDEAARWLAARWGACGAQLLGPEDLSIAGWSYQPHPDRKYTAVVNQRSISGAEITGVLTRLSYVPEQELTHIAHPDRTYVASEMTAFLSSWLNALRCPVLNRATPTCLSGPAWRREQWIYFAAHLGIPVCSVHRNTRRTADPDDKHSSPPDNLVAVVAGRCYGAPDERVADQARQLARAAGVDLLAAHFTKVEGTHKFWGADLWPDVTLPGVADAILDFLSGRRQPRFEYFAKKTPTFPTKAVPRNSLMPSVRRRQNV